MTGFHPILIGVAVLLAGAAVGVMTMLAPKNRAAFAYAQLAVMAGIYVGFAVSALDAADIAQRADWSRLLLESATALVFVLAGLAVLHTSRAWLLGVMILAHGGTDLVHLIATAAHSPAWYAFACIIYDAIVGVAAIYLLSDGNVEN